MQICVRHFSVTIWSRVISLLVKVHNLGPQAFIITDENRTQAMKIPLICAHQITHGLLLFGADSIPASVQHPDIIKPSINTPWNDLPEDSIEQQVVCRTMQMTLIATLMEHSPVLACDFILASEEAVPFVNRTVRDAMLIPTFAGLITSRPTGTNWLDHAIKILFGTLNGASIARLEVQLAKAVNSNVLFLVEAWSLTEPPSKGKFQNTIMLNKNHRY